MIVEVLAAAVMLAAVFGMMMWLLGHFSTLLERARERYDRERDSHYSTYTRLLRRERQIRKLHQRAEGLAEIAAASSLGAQLYQALMSDLHAIDQDMNHEEARH